jgi:hypothetical protein
MVKLRTALTGVPTLTTEALVPGAPVVVVPTVTVAATTGSCGSMVMLADSLMVRVIAIR